MVDMRKIVVIPTLVDEHLVGVRAEFKKIYDQQHVSSITINQQLAEITRLNLLLAEFKQRYEVAEAKLARIKDQL